MSQVTAATVAAGAGDRAGWGHKDRGGALPFFVSELGSWEGPGSLEILPGSFTPLPLLPGSRTQSRAGDGVPSSSACRNFFRASSQQHALWAVGFPDAAARVLLEQGAV